MAKKDNTVKKQVTERPVKKPTPRKRVAIDRNLQVLFMNNNEGGFFYRCPKTHNIYDMSEYGDVDYITIDELVTMRNTHRRILNELWILLIDIDSDEVSIEDVWEYLGLEHLYNDVVKPTEIDEFILRSRDDKFEANLNKMHEVLATKVVERAVVLYKQGKLNSIRKINAIKDFTGKEDLFD